MIIPIRVSATCLEPSRFEAARRHGGRCNATFHAETLEELAILINAHALEVHSGSVPCPDCGGTGYLPGDPT